MEFIKTYKDVAEFIYYITGPFILVGIGIAIMQLKAFKAESETRFKRETIITTLTILEQKLEQISDFYDIAFEGDLTDSMPEAQHEQLGVSMASSRLDSKWVEWYHDEDQFDFNNSVTNLLNAIEGLASYIFSGVTDEELCYKLEHTRTMFYIDLTQEYWAECREHDDSALFEGIHNLQVLWSEKLNHDESQKALISASKIAKSNPRPKSQIILGVKK